MPKTLLSSRSISFLRDLIETREMDPFPNWAELKWRTKPDRTVTQAVHRELEIAMKTFETNFQEKLKSSDEEHQKWLQNFMEKLDLKEETKAQLTEKMKGQWKPPILECQRRHHEKDNKFTKILERLELVSKVPAKEYKRSLGFIVVLEVLSACIAWMTISSMLIYRRFFKQFDGMFN